MRRARVAEFAVVHRAQKDCDVVWVLKRRRNQKNGVVPAAAVEFGDLSTKVELVPRRKAPKGRRLLHAAWSGRCCREQA